MTELIDVASQIWKYYVPAGNPQGKTKYTADDIYKIPYLNRRCETIDQAIQVSKELSPIQTGWVDGFLKDDIVLIDFDNSDSFEAVLRLVNGEKLNCLAVRSRRGGHVFFKKTDDFRNVNTRHYNALTLFADYKAGGKRKTVITPLCLPDGQFCTVEYFKDDIDFCPWYFMPLWKTLDNIPRFSNMGKDTKYTDFRRYAIEIKKAGKTYDDYIELASLLNTYIIADSLPQEELETCIRRGVWDDVENTNGSFRHYTFGKCFMEKHHAKIYENRLYIYDNGIYTADKNIIRRYIRAEKDSLKDCQIRETLLYMHDRATVVNEIEKYVVFQNGIYDSGKLIPFNPDIFATAKLACNYNINAQCADVDKFLNTITERDSATKQQLIECGAAALIGSQRLKKCVILYGISNSGKSTFIDMLTAAIGRENTSAITLQELNQRFKTAELADKLLNVSEDTPEEYIKDTSLFKKVVSGEYLTAEYKGEKPFKFRPRCFLLCAANELPRLNDKTEAALKRILLIPLNAQIENPDYNLRERLQKQDASEYIMKLAVDSLDGLLKNGFTSTRQSEQTKEEYKELVNPIRGFLRSISDRGETITGIDTYGNVITTDDVFSDYLTYCEKNRYECKSKNIFCRSICAISGYEVKVIRTKEGAKKAFVNSKGAVQ